MISFITNGTSCVETVNSQGNDGSSSNSNGEEINVEEPPLEYISSQVNQLNSIPDHENGKELTLPMNLNEDVPAPSMASKLDDFNTKEQLLSTSDQTSDDTIAILPSQVKVITDQVENAVTSQIDMMMTDLLEDFKSKLWANAT